MKITLKIPDDIVEDFAERNLYVFAGIDLVAHKYRGEKNWTVKIQRCSQCGTCCQNLKEQHLIINYTLFSYSYLTLQ